MQFMRYLGAVVSSCSMLVNIEYPLRGVLESHPPDPMII